MQEIITSRDNPRIKNLRNLLLNKEHRYAQRQYVLEGLRLVQSMPDLVEAYALPDLDIQLNCPIIRVNQKVLEYITDTEHPQGVVAVAAMPAMVKLDPAALYVYADRIQDPGNMGTLIRTAAAFKTHVLIGPGCVDPYSPKVVRSTMGGLAQATIAFVTIAEIPRPWIVADMAGSALSKIQWPNKGTIIIGSESHGVAQELLAAADTIVSIPIVGVESLNASIAAGILLQDRFKNQLK